MSSKKKRPATQQAPKAESVATEEPEGLPLDTQSNEGFSIRADNEGYAIYLNSVQVGKATRMGDKLRVKLKNAASEYVGICGKPFFSDKDEILNYLHSNKDQLSETLQC